VLSIGKLRDPNYYLAMVADGQEEYYANAKEAPGVWMGRSAGRLGLYGEVDADALHRVLDHRDPKTGARLIRAQGAPKVPGFDATFCAPKSVSLLFALGDPEISNEVRNAHDAAVTAALRALEDVAARARRGKGGTERLVAEGFVAAAFRHRTSRAGDPHLHTHVLAANLVFSPQDQRWSALDARPLYGWAKTVGYLYEAQLRAELTRRLGVEWTQVRRGIADIKGIPKMTLRAFSRRRAEIQAHMAERGETTARAAQVATYATRKPKDASADVEGLLPEWRERARTLGLDEDSLADLIDRVSPARVPETGTAAAEELFTALAAPDGLTAEVSTFSRKEALQAICDRLPAGADIGQVVALAKAFVESDHVVAIGVPERLWTSDVLRRLDGKVVPAHLDLLRWTTPEMLATESHLINGALSRREDLVGIADPESVHAALVARPLLSHEQVAMVERLTGSGAGVDVVVGVAGSGKTFALGAASEAWVASDHRVIGAALSARAAAELQDGSGIPSTTIARLLADLDRPDADGLPTRCVLVVDEGAMVGTRQLARLLDHAQAARAKVVLAGDHHQLTEIDAGGAFASLAHLLDAVALTENRRQHQAWERDALAELRHGNPDVALAAYQAHDRLHQANTWDGLREQLVDDWWAARQAGGRHLMVASRHIDVDDLNRRARRRLAAAGLLGDDLSIGERRFAVGDDVLATRNDYRIMVFNGTRATITGIDPDARRIDAVDPTGNPMTIPFAYAEAGHLTWGYATTLHKAQGATLDQTFLLADDTLHRERSYSGLSRGVESNDLYLAVPDDEEHHSAQENDDLIERLRQTVNHSDAKTLALDDLLSGPAPAAPSTIDELWAERRRLAPIVNRAPHPPFDALAALDRDQQRAVANLAKARQERRAAEEALEELGGHRRLTRRRDRQQAEQRLDRAEGLLSGAESVLEHVGQRRTRLDGEMAEWREWTAEHGHEASRLREVDSLIAEHRRQRQPSLGREQGLSRNVERDVGIDLGL
jgi:conjugative relaxase-like TrwC/TraI family protein